MKSWRSTLLSSHFWSDTLKILQEAESPASWTTTATEGRAGCQDIKGAGWEAGGGSLSDREMIWRCIIEPYLRSFDFWSKLSSF
mmetsp:Transcript_28588/g.58437  ORF Transcript_28588/g.58437 Transcript_28588/m.58437 type:complete len:84 (-) Transcript_28588:56-307(-)